ncbi:MAG: aminotransferase, partial [Gammaproteobacteria bacterium]|nr:aminotransferase [Gammaproteobacteria bacterium]
MHIAPFGVEIWMNEFEKSCELNLAETCVESITLAELLALCGKNEALLSELLPFRMDYGDIRGSDRLRAAIASLYERQTFENTLVTHGTIGANSLVHQALISRGDRVISVIPTYQQHYSIPESIGADVHLLHLQPENRFLPDLDKLRAMASPAVRLIAINNPNNPTGSLMDRTTLEAIAEIADKIGAWVLCDEVYRGTDQEGRGKTASMADLYEKGISTAGMSKAFSLAGLRIGWLTGPPEVIEQVMIHRDYNTISVSKIDEYFAAIALENHQAILERSRRITRENLAILADWVKGEPLISWVRPCSGTTALLKFAFDMPSRDFCIQLLNETGVMFTPGSAMAMEGYVRIGYANNVKVLKTGLRRVSGFLKQLAD